MATLLLCFLCMCTSLVYLLCVQIYFFNTLPDGVVAAEAVIVQDLEVEDPLHHLLVGETWGTDSAGEEPAGTATRSLRRARLLSRKIAGGGGGGGGLALCLPAAALLGHSRQHPHSHFSEGLARAVTVSCLP